MYDHMPRQNKAHTTLMVLEDYFGGSIKDKTLINVGGSAGIIDEYLARHCAFVVGTDIDEKAIAYAQQQFQADNLTFAVADAMQLQYADNSFDIAVCSHVYEHVPDAKKMMAEIQRILKPGGVCYFAAGNRLMWNEPHYNLKLLSVIPRPLAHVYIRLAGKADYYYEQHLSYWGLKALIRPFTHIEYTRKIIENPEQYGAEYMLKPNTKKSLIARIVAKYAVWLLPSYIWILENPADKK
jgi:ubiquinone/menaquinone biosynthesis C-methylase UbiE